MNARSTLPVFLIIAIATCAACDRRVSTGSSSAQKEGQGDTHETAQDLRETATPPQPAPETEAPATDRSSEAPVGNAPPAQDTTTQEQRGDTLGRP